MDAVVEWANANQGFVFLVLTLAYVIATLFIWRVNQQAVAEMRESRLAETRPYVIATLSSSPSFGNIDFLIMNIGKTPAYNVSFRADPPLENPSRSEFQLADSVLFQHGMACMPPRFEDRLFFAMPGDFPEEARFYDRKYQFTVAYDDVHGNKYEEVYIYDPHIHGLPRITPRDMDRLVQEIERFHETVKSAGDLIGRAFSKEDSN